jgi:mannose-6-phosphate isomerase-like protein (cupin superfamily)
MKSSHEILTEMTNIYSSKVSKDLSLIVQLKQLSENETWFISVAPGQQASLAKSSQQAPQIMFSFTKKTLFDIYSGRMTGFTAIARENLSDHSPLDFQLGPGVEMTPEVLDQLYEFIQHFFNTTLPEMIITNKSHARLVHGAYAIPLFYHTGFRSAWYQVEKGQKLNKIGDTNPFSQAFIIIQGKGYAKIGDFIQEITAGNTYYVPPESDHVLWTNEEMPLQLIYLAWGDQA